MFKYLKMFPIAVDLENNDSYYFHIEYLVDSELYHSVIYKDDEETYVMSTYAFEIATLIDIPEFFGELSSTVYSNLHLSVDDFLDKF